MEKTWLFGYGEQIGKKHIKNNIPCQDKALCSTENEVSVAIVSDGCGSSTLSHYGSNATVNALKELFTTQFDEIYNGDVISNRIKIIDTIIEAQLSFAENNKEIFTEYIQDNNKEYKKSVADKKEDEFLLATMFATALFVAVKNDKYIIGQIGDGIIGAVINNKLKIIMEEEKLDDISGTTYPANIYIKARKDKEWYKTNDFIYKKPVNATIKAFILTSDGSDAFFDRRTPFEKKYTRGVDRLFNTIVKANGIEDSQKVIHYNFLPSLVSMSVVGDDCSLAVLVKPDYSIDPIDGFEIKRYPKPEFVKEKEEIYKGPTEESIERVINKIKTLNLDLNINQFYQDISPQIKDKTEQFVLLEDYFSLLENIESMETIVAIINKMSRHNFRCIYDFDDSPLSTKLNLYLGKHI